MVDQIAVVKFTTRATPGTQSITHPSITEAFSAAIFLYGGGAAGTDDSAIAHGFIGCGFVAPDNGGAVQTDQAIGVAAENALDTSTDCGTHNSTANSIVVPNSNPPAAADIVAAFSSSVPGGVEMNFTTTARQVEMTAILFAGLARAAVGIATSTVVSALETVGGTTDFEPDLLIALCSSGALSSILGNASPNLGFAVNGGGQITAGVDADDSVTTTDADGYVLSARATAHIEPGRTLEDVTVTSFAATGFNHVASAGSPDWHYLALQFSGNVRLAVANFAAPASTGPATFNDFGFTPDLVLGISTLIGALDTLTDGATAGASGYFVTGRYGSRAYSWRQQEGQALAGAPVTAASSRQGDHAVLTLDHLGAVAQQASWLGASGSGGFLLDFTTATAGFLTALGIQLVPNPPLPERRRRVVRRARARYRRRPVLVGGRPVGPLPLSGRLLRAILRQRRQARARLFWRPTLVPTVALVGDVLEEGSILGIASPGLIRGDVVGAGVASGEVEA